MTHLTLEKIQQRKKHYPEGSITWLALEQAEKISKGFLFLVTQEEKATIDKVKSGELVLVPRKDGEIVYFLGETEMQSYPSQPQI